VTFACAYVPFIPGTRARNAGPAHRCAKTGRADFRVAVYRETAAAGGVGPAHWPRPWTRSESSDRRGRLSVRPDAHAEAHRSDARVAITSAQPPRIRAAPTRPWSGSLAMGGAGTRAGTANLAVQSMQTASTLWPSGSIKNAA
jgi:hypothetical protein